MMHANDRPFRHRVPLVRPPVACLPRVMIDTDISFRLALPLDPDERVCRRDQRVRERDHRPVDPPVQRLTPAVHLQDHNILEADHRITNLHLPVIGTTVLPVQRTGRTTTETDHRTTATGADPIACPEWMIDILPGRIIDTAVTRRSDTALTIEEQDHQKGLVILTDGLGLNHDLRRHEVTTPGIAIVALLHPQKRSRWHPLTQGVQTQRTRRRTRKVSTFRSRQRVSYRQRAAAHNPAYLRHHAECLHCQSPCRMIANRRLRL